MVVIVNLFLNNWFFDFFRIITCVLNLACINCVIVAKSFPSICSSKVLFPCLWSGLLFIVFKSLHLVYIEVILSEVVMAAHQQKSIVSVAAARELIKVIVGQVGLTLGGWEVLVQDWALACLFLSLFVEESMSSAHYIRRLVVCVLCHPEICEFSLRLDLFLTQLLVAPALDVLLLEFVGSLFTAVFVAAFVLEHLHLA